MKPKSDYKETVFYQNIGLPMKDKWVAYFHLLYSERDIEHDRMTKDQREVYLKDVGIKITPEVTECLEGCNAEWIRLLNGFFRHYFNRLYTEYCMALLNYEKLVEAQFRETGTQGEIGKQTENLARMKDVRMLIDALEKELYNNKHGSYSNIVNPNVLFKDTPVEKQAKTRRRDNPRKRAQEGYE